MISEKLELVKETYQQNSVAINVGGAVIGAYLVYRIVNKVFSKRSDKAEDKGDKINK